MKKTMRLLSIILGISGIGMLLLAGVLNLSSVGWIIGFGMLIVGALIGLVSAFIAGNKGDNIGSYRIPKV